MSESENNSSYNKDSLRNTLLVAIGVCLVCSILVSLSAVALRPQQQANKLLDQKQNVLRAAGILPADDVVDAQGRGIEELFDAFEVRVVDLDTGSYVEGVDPQTFDPIRASKELAASAALSPEEDTATLGRRENQSLVYIKRDAAGGIERIVMPVRGYGLWGTLFGYLALEGDIQTIAGLGFYSHKETPGLGGEVDNPNWKAAWPGVIMFDSAGNPAISLVKSRAPADSAAAKHEVDALSGATFTTKGVENMMRYWMGEGGFGPYLEKLKAGTV